MAQQSPVSVSTFLTAEEKSSKIKTQNDRIAFLKESSGNMPVIDDVEFRIRNSAYEFDRQRYSLRFEPRGFGETRASKNLYKANLKCQKQRKSVLEGKLIRSRYNLVLDFMYLQAMVALNKGLLILYEDRIAVMKNSTGSLKFNVVDIITIENEFTKLKFNNIERERKFTSKKDKIKDILSAESFDSFDTTSFISIDQIKEHIDSSQFVLDPDNVYIEYGKRQLELAKRKYKLETAEGRQYINFFQFSYDHDNMKDEQEVRDANASLPDYLKEDYNFNRAYLFDIGLRIPLFNVDRHDINRRKLSYLSEKEDFKELKNELQNRIEKDSEDIRILISQYSFLLARRNDVNAESSLKKYLEMEGVDPIKLLSIKESVIRNDIKIEKIKYDILKNYIRIIDATGQLYAQADSNYLSAHQDPIKK